MRRELLLSAGLLIAANLMAAVNVDVGRQLFVDDALVVVSDYSRTKEREISFVRFNPDDGIDGRKRLERRLISCGGAK